MRRNRQKKGGLARRLSGIEIVKPFSARPELLLHPNIPKPMHGLAPRIILGPDWWNRVRREAYRSTGFRCAACGVAKENAAGGVLDAHEVYDIDYVAGRMVYVEAVPLCRFCHRFIHDGRLFMQLQSGAVSQAEFDSVMSRGFKILGRAKPLLIREAPWKSWRLVLFGKEYPSLFDNYRQWEAYYRGKETYSD